MKLRITILLSVLHFFVAGYADELTEWTKNFGGRFNDKAEHAILTDDGGILIVGWTDSKGEGGKDGWVVKLTGKGDVFFEQTFGKGKDDIFYGVVENPNGGFTATGSTVDEQNGYTKAWVVHFDELGELDWEKTYGPSEYASGKKIIYTPNDKGYLLLTTREEKGDHDMNSWVLKLNKKGNMLWQSVSDKRYLNDEGQNMVLTQDGGYLISGYVSDKYKAKNFYTVKYDQRGTKKWSEEYGGEENDESFDLLITTNGYFLTSGITSSEGKGGSDGKLILTDKTGRVAAESVFGGISNDTIFSVIETSDGFIAAGKTESKGKGGNDNWIVQVDKDLQFKWQYISGDAGEQDVKTVLKRDEALSFFTVGNTLKSGSQSYDMVVTKYSGDIFDENKREAKVSVAPVAANSPNITIISPMVRRGFKTIVNTQTSQVKGRVSTTSGLKSVTVNGKEALLSEGGNFSVYVTVQIGSNNVMVVATEKNGTVHKKSFTMDRAANLKSGETADFRAVAGKYYALLIGVEDYADEEINNLDRPIDDALMLFNTLTTYYTFEKENVEVLKNPTRTDIIMALDDLSKRVSEDDNLVIFYAGHGYWDPEKKLGYWLPADAMKSNTANWVRNSTIRDYVSAIKSKHTLLIADACFSGGIFKTRSAFTNASKAISMLHKLNSRKAMTSGTLKEVPDQSAFIKYLNKQLINNEKDYMPSEELFSMFRMAVINNSPNVPQYGTIKDSGDEGGEFIFIKRK